MSNQQADFNPTEWIVTKEAAELTGYAGTHLRVLIGRGRLHGWKRGRDWFLDEEEVLVYAEEMKRLGRPSTIPGEQEHGAGAIPDDFNPTEWIATASRCSDF